ncbi:DUF945 domain-containing protein [Methylobacillus caricis]|uniref:DUF932 domain-containing protein n=1 Tax=Methylobacillus caricis TaxID=1971611 RepID=UPI001CFF8045|nr:DUF945 domain-containing protein [Methylobacillus caricis]
MAYANELPWHVLGNKVSLATTAQFTSGRVVCNNTLQIALDDRIGMVRIPHSRSFDPKEVKEVLSLGMTSWDKFKVAMQELALRPVNRFDANAYFVKSPRRSRVASSDIWGCKDNKKPAVTRVFRLSWISLERYLVVMGGLEPSTPGL